MAPKDYLTVLTFVALFIGLAAGVISQITKTSETVEGSNIKRLTTAGKLALGISLAGFVGSFSSELLKVYIATAQKQADAIESERRKERQQIEDQWRQRSEQLLNAAVSKADENLRHVVDGFKNEQQEFLRGRLDAAEHNQKLLNDNLIRETRLYARLSAASTPLTRLRARLTVEGVPDDVLGKMREGIEKASKRPDAPDFEDLALHHNVDDEDAANLVRSEMDKLVIQPFITWMATGKFELKQGILMLGLGDHFAAIACIGWIATPGLFDPGHGNIDRGRKARKKGDADKPKVVSKLPSGILIGREIEWKLGWEGDTRDYARERNVRPATTIDVSDRSVVLTIDFDHGALHDALLRYAEGSTTTASLSDRLIFVAWSPSPSGDSDDNYPLTELPFSSKEIGPSLTGLTARTIDPTGKPPQWAGAMKIEMVPNSVKEIGKEYELVATADEELMEGPRGDDSRGYARVWHGRTP